MSEAEGGDCASKGKAALVTGGSSGLGRATAVALAGADVALTARIAKELESAGRDILEMAHRMQFW